MVHSTTSTFGTVLWIASSDKDERQDGECPYEQHHFIHSGIALRPTTDRSHSGHSNGRRPTGHGIHARIVEDWAFLHVALFALILLSASMRPNLLVPAIVGSLVANAQPVPAGVQPYVDYWDSLKTVKRSEGLFINGREWNEWKFWAPNGHLTEVADFKSGERDGHVVIYYDNDTVRHDGWVHKGKQDSTMRSFYRTGRPMEAGRYRMGVKEGVWSYWYANGEPLMKELWEDSICLLTDAWDSTGVATVIKGDGVSRSYYPSGALQKEANYRLGVVSGPYQELWPTGDPKVKGNNVAGVRTGEWTWYFVNGKKEKKAMYAKGKLNGPYTVYFDDGQDNTTGYYLNGQKDSTWTWFTADGKREMLGHFKADQQHGLWKYWYKNEQLSSTGLFAYGEQEGEWVYYYEGGENWKRGTWKAGRKDGLWTTWFESGQKLQEGNYVNGKEEGEWKSWFANGQQKDIGSFKAGGIDGKWQGWYPDGKPEYSGTWANDAKNGAWKFWHQNGQPKEEGPYKDGKKNGRWVAHSTHGIPISEGLYVNNTPHGPWTYFDDAGVKMREQSFVNGDPDGKCTVYDMRGRVVQEMTYRMGKLDGTMTMYGTDGRVLKTIDYENGSVKKNLPPKLK